MYVFQVFGECELAYLCFREREEKKEREGEVKGWGVNLVPWNTFNQIGMNIFNSLLHKNEVSSRVGQNIQHKVRKSTPESWWEWEGYIRHVAYYTQLSKKYLSWTPAIFTATAHTYIWPVLLGTVLLHRAFFISLARGWIASQLKQHWPVPSTWLVLMECDSGFSQIPSGWSSSWYGAKVELWFSCKK